MDLKKLLLIKPCDQPPPPGEETLTAYAAGHYLGCYTSSIRFWVERGLLRGGAYHITDRNNLIWWVSKKDLDAVKREGNGIHQIGFKLRGMKLVGKIK